MQQRRINERAAMAVLRQPVEQDTRPCLPLLWGFRRYGDSDPSIEMCNIFEMIIQKNTLIHAIRFFCRASPAIVRQTTAAYKKVDGFKGKRIHREKDSDGKDSNGKGFKGKGIQRERD